MALRDLLSIRQRNRNSHGVPPLIVPAPYVALSALRLTELFLSFWIYNFPSPVVVVSVSRGPDRHQDEATPPSGSRRALPLGEQVPDLLVVYRSFLRRSAM